MQNNKRMLDLIWKEFIYGGHLIALGGVGISISAAILLNIKITWDFLVIIYLATYIFLLYNRSKEFKSDFLTNPERTKYLEKYRFYINKIIIIFIVFFILILVYFGKIKKIGILFFGLSLFITGLLYTLFLKKITKKIIAFKNFIFSLLAASVVIFLAVYYSYPFNLSLLLITIFVFLRLLVNTVFLDIKDIESDEKENLLTLPIIFKEKSKIHAFLCLVSIIAVTPIIFGIYLNIFPLFSLMLLLTIPYTFYYVQKSREKSTNFIFLNYILADLEFILWIPFLILGKALIKALI